MKRYLVTGGASFIGSHLVDALIANGDQVVVVDDFSSGRIENLALRPGLKVIVRDLFSGDVPDEAVHGVYHLANVHGGRGYIDTHPGDMTKNLAIDSKVFNYCAKRGLPVVYASSACVYPPTRQERGASFSLSERMRDIAPAESGVGGYADGVYGFCKMAGEIALHALNKQHGLRYAACRIFTAYGPRENESHAIMAFIARASLRLDPFEVWGDGTQVRNFTYVDDVVRGLTDSMRVITESSTTTTLTINVGSDVGYTIKETVATVLEVAGYHPGIKLLEDKPTGPHSRIANTEYFHKLFAWRPATPLRTGIEKTMAWWQSTHGELASEIWLAERLMSR